QIFSYNWSPDSKWITYTSQDVNRFGIIYIYNVETSVKKAVTDNWYTSSQANFSNDGKYLVFVSDRDFNPIYSQTEWNHAYRGMSKIYMVLLSKDTSSPFALENNEVAISQKTEEIKKDDSKKADKPKEDTKKEVSSVVVKIDFDDIISRIIALPIEVANYGNLYCIDGKVYYNYFSFNGRRGGAAKMYDLKNKSEVDLGESIGFSISSNGKKMLVSKK
nr:protease [Tenuifilaceae bacterium]